MDTIPINCRKKHPNTLSWHIGGGGVVFEKCLWAGRVQPRFHLLCAIGEKNKGEHTGMLHDHKTLNKNNSPWGNPSLPLWLHKLGSMSPFFGPDLDLKHHLNAWKIVVTQASRANSKTAVRNQEKPDGGKVGEVRTMLHTVFTGSFLF